MRLSIDFEFNPLKVFSHLLRDSIPSFVGRSVRPSVSPSNTLLLLFFFAVFGLTAVYPAMLLVQTSQKSVNGENVTVYCIEELEFSSLVAEYLF